jgi:protein-disulfide isomerase
MTSRRTLLALTSGLALVPTALLAQAPQSSAPETDPRLTERSFGRADAPVTVLEHFSLTCGHCAAFHTGTWPRVKSELVAAGRMRLVFRDFPLDSVALAAAVIARSLPPERYEPFLTTLFASQNRWAFVRGGNPAEELAKLAAVAGLSRGQFDEALADQALARGILEQRVQAQQQFNVASTPTFVFGTRVVPGNMDFARFAQLVSETR